MQRSRTKDFNTGIHIWSNETHDLVCIMMDIKAYQFVYNSTQFHVNYMINACWLILISSHFYYSLILIISWLQNPIHVHKNLPNLFQRFSAEVIITRATERKIVRRKGSVQSQLWLCLHKKKKLLWQKFWFHQTEQECPLWNQCWFHPSAKEGPLWKLKCLSCHCWICLIVNNRTSKNSVQSFIIHTITVD